MATFSSLLVRSRRDFFLIFTMKTWQGSYQVSCLLAQSCLTDLFMTPWTVARQTLLSRGFPREYWSGLPFHSPECLPHPETEPTSPPLSHLESQMLTPVIVPFPRFCFAKLYSLKVKVKSLSRVRLFVTPWTVAYQAPLSMGFSRQQYWSGFPFLYPGDLPNPGIKPWSPALQTDALLSETPGKSLYSLYMPINLGEAVFPVISLLEGSKKSFLFLAVGKMKPVLSKLLICWTGNQKSSPTFVFFLSFFF